MENLFRLMQKLDYEGVYSLWMKCKNMGFNNVDDSEKGISKYLERNPKTCFVCVQNEKVVGVILSGHDCRRGFIHHLAVDPDFRRHGIATELLRRAFEDLKMTTVWCGYYEGNEKSKRVQQKCGFEFFAKNDNVPVPLMNEISTGYMNRITKEMWGNL